MTDTKKKNCPTCQGKGFISSEHEGHVEWEGVIDEPDDVQSTPEALCPTCNGKGYEE